jgi:hypothetical protein
MAIYPSAPIHISGMGFKSLKTQLYDEFIVQALNKLNNI